MLQLRPVNFLQIQPFFVDYQKKSKNYEMPPEQSECVGIYRGEELIGYFIVLTYDSILEINQGYLKPEARHKNLSKISMTLLEQKAKAVGIKKVMLATNRAVGSYQSFMKNLGYNITKAIFEKSI